MFALCSCGARTGIRVPDAAGVDSAIVDAETLADTFVANDRVMADVTDVTDVTDATDVTDVSDAADAVVVPSVCGNAILESGEQCDHGAMNQLVPAFAVSQSGIETAVQPVARRSSPTAFYRYESASAHTGFEAVGLATLFLYVDTSTADDELSMFAIAGVDDLGTGNLQPAANISAHFGGVPIGARVVLSDDPGELLGGLPGAFNAMWNFNQNTDGGVISGLPWPTAWTIAADETFSAGITAWHYVDRDGSAHGLAMRTRTLLIHRITATACRPDCRLPRCGDGFVDAGERCDDGNNVSGDGCAADCQRIE